ncbi:MAG TPA: hypothetical protein VLJ86_03650 [Ramlibacter sp.]|nr:hypothetical protein [Ramlibacter sp.]
MNKLELFIWIVAIVGFVLSQIVRGKWGKKAPDTPAAAPPVLPRQHIQTTPPPPAAQAASDARSALASAEWGRNPTGAQALQPPAAEDSLPPPMEPASAAPALAEPAPAAPAKASPYTRRRHPLFDVRRDLRHTVIGATVLGPCRALSPYDGATGVPPISR